MNVGEEQDLLKPISGQLCVESTEAKERIIVTGLTTVESNISFRDLLTLQAIGASMSAAKKKPEEVEGPAGPSALDPARAGPSAPPVELLDLTEDQISLLEPEVEPEEPESEADTPKTIDFELPDELRLVLRLFDDCSSITKPFIDSHASL